MSALQTLEEEQPAAERQLALLEQSIEETGGMIPRWHFEHYPRVFPQASIELALVRERDGQKEVFMFRRPEDDPHWPNELHMPGTTLYALDNEEKMWGRLLRNELGNAFTREDFALAFNHVTTRQDRERGACMHGVYVCHCDPDTEFASGRFYPIDNPPDETITHHVHMIGKLVSYLG